MLPAHRSRLQTLSIGLYRLLLLLYPKAYRNSYSLKMARTFSDCCDFAYTDGGLVGLIKLWVPTLLDLSATAIEKHVEDGLLSSRLAGIRVASLAAIVGSGLIFTTGWSADGKNLIITSLFVVGALGWLVTSPSTINAIRGREIMSNSAIQSSTETRWPQARSTLWAVSALVGLAVFDLVDNAQDIARNASYVQPMIEQYGPFLAFLIGAAPRLIVYLAGGWLYRKESAWAAAPALIMAVPRAIFSVEAVSGLLARTRTESYESMLVNLAALVLVLAVVVTSLWAVVELRKSKRLD